MTDPTIFTPFPKLGRMARNCVITEKLDGTNAQIVIMSGREYFAAVAPPPPVAVIAGLTADEDRVVLAGSRTRWIAPNNGVKGMAGATDNYGFAAWVRDNADELLKLGPGQHFGEWWGQGIQRNYGLTERRFSLFNVGRWSNPELRPACCHVVPVIYNGIFTTTAVDDVLAELAANGSAAVPGFMKPEGVVVFHSATGTLFKKTIEKDDEPKGRQVAA